MPPARINFRAEGDEKQVIDLEWPYSLLFVPICVGVSCNLAYNFTTNVHSDMVCSGMQNSKLFCMWEIVQ